MQGDELAILLFFLTLAITFGVEAVKAETLARRVGFGIVAGGFLITGLGWHQLEKTWPKLGDWVSPVATNPMSWFIVLMFLAAIFAFSPTKIRTPPRQSEPSNVAIEAAEEEEKTIIQIDPVSLIKMCKSLPGLQAQALMVPYIGKWARVTGPVQNTDNILKKYITVTLELPEDDGRYQILAFFELKWRPKIETLQMGKSIQVFGRILSISGYVLSLEGCELV